MAKFSFLSFSCPTINDGRSERNEKQKISVAASLLVVGLLTNGMQAKADDDDYNHDGYEKHEKYEKYDDHDDDYDHNDDYDYEYEDDYDDDDDQYQNYDTTNVVNEKGNGIYGQDPLLSIKKCYLLRIQNKLY